MRKLIYSFGVSLDGFIAGPDGEIDWSAPDEELHRFHNQQARELGAHFCGRRLYEAGPHRRVPAIRQPGRTGRRHALLPGPGREDQPGARRDTDVWLARRLRSLSPIGALTPGGR